MKQFHLRDLFYITAIAAICVCWWLDSRRHALRRQADLEALASSRLESKSKNVELVQLRWCLHHYVKDIFIDSNLIRFIEKQGYTYGSDGTWVRSPKGETVSLDSTPEQRELWKSREEAILQEAAIRIR